MPEVLFFPPFRLDCAAQLLLRGTERVPLRPKTFAVLRHLVECSGRVVTSEELLASIWEGVHVSEALPRDSILEIRRALGDTAAAPRFVETMRGHGYRFVAAVTREAPPDAVEGVVGRTTELGWVAERLTRAVAGERRVTFVAGEAGIGKTTLVDAVCRQAHARGVRTVRGQCVEHFGPGEPYMPVLSALGELCRGDDGHTVALLRAVAPTWLLQLPSATAGMDLEDLARRAQGGTRERMLREIGDAFEALTAERPLVLVLEDLHWSDPSTLEVLSVLARGRIPARLLAIATYRPLDVLANGHPLRAVTEELRLHRYCEELRLPFLGEGDVAEYVARRLRGRGAAAVEQIARVVHRRTEGNPLFMVAVLDDLLAGERLAQVDGRWTLPAEMEGISAPRDVRAMIERQLDRLDDEERRLLTAASVVGLEFSAAAVAAALGEPLADVEACCDLLARREQFVRAHGRTEWPDGTVAPRYVFGHALHRDVVYERATPSARRTLHGRVAERLERAYGRHAGGGAAAELATHFEHAGVPTRACACFRQAAEDALRRYAYREAIAHLRNALRVVAALPEATARRRTEFDVQVSLGLLLATHGAPAPEVEGALARAQEIGGRLGDPLRLMYSLGGTWGARFGRGEVRSARTVAEQVSRLAAARDGDGLGLAGDFALGLTLVYDGSLAAAEQHLRRVLASHDPAQLAAFRRTFDPAGVIEPRVVARAYLAIVRWHRGHPADAVAEIASARDVALVLDNPYLAVVAEGFAAMVHLLRREVESTADVAARQIALAREHGFPQWASMGAVLTGWSRALRGEGRGGVQEIQAGLAAWRATGAGIGRTLLLAILADACLAWGDTETGLAAIAEALELAQESGERVNQAELLRLRGELLTLGSGTGGPRAAEAAEQCFRDAIAVARPQGARSYALRAGIGLARRWLAGGREAQARRLLAPLVAAITGGDDTDDVRAAIALLRST